jgi:hypothetical protein
MDEYLLRLEKNLMVGSGRWVADFAESFRGYRIGDTVFDMMVRGGMKTKGFFLSRLLSYFLLPTYGVACFVYCREPTKRTLSQLIGRLSDYMAEKGLGWSWLVIAKQGAFPPQVRKAVEEMELKEIGVALVDLASEEVITGRAHVGRRMRSHVRCFR